MRVSPNDLKSHKLSSQSSSSKNDKTEKQASKWHVPKEVLAGMGDIHKPWKEMTTIEKIEQVVFILVKLLMLFFVVFVFICTLGLLSTSFKLLAGKGLGRTIKQSPFLRNPISASIIGMVISLVLQSSSVLISLLVGMVAGKLITVHQAIPILMGGELGSSLMNVLVSMGLSGNRDQFRRAFACASLNDAFNVMNYLTVLPMEIAFNVLERLSGLLVKPLSNVRTKKFRALQVLTDPILNKIVMIDNEALVRVSSIAASGNTTALEMVDRKSFIYRCINLDSLEKLNFCPYNHIFAKSLWSDSTIGICLLIASIALLIFCLYGIVKVMSSLLGGRIAMLVNKLVTYKLPQPFTFLTSYISMVVAALIVVVMESSSVFRSALTPLVGIGVIPLHRYYPFVVGSNIGTTSTGVIAALASDPSQLQETLQIALAQTLFNLFGLLLFYPIPFMRRIPLKIAMKLGDTVAKYRWFSIVYIICVFFLLPSFLLLLSFLPSAVMLTIISIIATFLTIVAVTNWFQVSFPKCLPKKLRNWDFLPDYLHSLKPYDKLMVHMLRAIPCCPNRFITPVKVDEIYSDSDSNDTDSHQKNDDLLYKQLTQQTPV